MAGRGGTNLTFRPLFIGSQNGTVSILHVAHAVLGPQGSGMGICDLRKKKTKSPIATHPVFADTERYIPAGTVFG